MTKAKLWFTFIFALLCGLPYLAYGAQDAVITVEQAAIRERPSLDAKIIESKPVGSQIRVSDFGKDGWYKTKSSIGQFGWVWQADLSLQNFSDDIKASNLEMPDRIHERRTGMRLPWVFLRLGVVTSPLVSMIGEDKGHLHIAAGGYLELTLRNPWRDDTRFGVRLMTYTNVFGIAFSPNDTDISPGITGFMFGIEHDLQKNETNDLSVAVYAGFNIGSSTTIVQSVGAPGTVPTQLSTTPPNTTPGASPLVPYNGYPILLNVVYKYYFTRWLTAVGEVGFFWDYINQVDIPNYGNQHINQYGPMGSLGLQFGF